MLGLIARGWSRVRIVETVRKSWGVDQSMAYRYYKTCERRIAKLYEHKQEHLLAEMLLRHDDLRDKGYEQLDYRLVLATDQEDARLLGLYPEEKRSVRHSFERINDEIEAELAALAALGAAEDADDSEGETGGS